MKITFIVPSTQWLSAAGVRIRYKRLEPFFHSNGYLVSIIPLQNLTETCIRESDIVIISKVFTPDSLYIISLCRSLGVKVGIDLFDDYFSDQRLSIFRKFHDWLQLASKTIDFIICSTERMKFVASKFINPELVHKINDTKDPNIEFAETNQLLIHKSTNIFANKSLNVLWFGIGDNPYFNVGIHDLSNYSNALFQLSKLPCSIRFTILTNERALTAKNLIKISRLPIQPQLEIWSESKEADYLKDAHLALMPVSHQNFSIAKSSNRCLTALTFGCQVLSNGFNLYEDFSDLIYKSTRDFIVDYKESRFKFNPDSINIFEKVCNHSYDCENEVSQFISFLDSKVFQSGLTQSMRFCMVHTKSFSPQLSSNLIGSQFPVIDGSTLSLTPSTNIGIEEYNKNIYFVFSNNIDNLLLERWHKYLQVNPADQNEHYRVLSVNQIKDIIPEMSTDLHTVVTTRFTERNSDKVQGFIQSEIFQSTTASALHNIVKSLFGYSNLYFSDGNNKIKPFLLK
jgi:hypothetical protein